MTKTQDWDAWTHLALGREMVRLQGFPALEPFNFPSNALPYYNTEWLFALILYVAYASAGFAGLVLLKAGLASLAALILWKDSGLGRDPSVDPTLDVAIRAAVLLPSLFLIWYRIVERPDLALMVFLSYTIYALNAYFYEGRRYLYTLPVIQLVWVNMHPSAVLAAVPFLAFLVGGQVLRWWGVQPPRAPSPTQLRTVGVVAAAVILVSFLNPHGVYALVDPFRLATSIWHQENIAELQPPPIMGLPAPFILTPLLAVTFLATSRRLPLVSALLVAPFAYLGFSAIRFVFLLVIVAGPVLARNLSAMAATVTLAWVRRACLGVTSAAALAGLLVVCLGVARVESFANPTTAFGVGVNDRFLPERALSYLDAAGVEGRVFNPYHWGGYLAWRDFPRRAPIIDGRGYVPPGLLETIQAAPLNPRILEHLHAVYGFDIVLMNYPGIPTDARVAPDTAMDPAWALVYWDDVASVFLRRSPRLAHIISRDEYRYVNPAHGVPHLRHALTNASNLEAIEAELHRNVAHTGSSIGHALLGFAHLQRRDLDRAIEAFRRADRYSAVWHASQGLALAYWQKGDLPKAIGHYKALASLSSDPVFPYNIGLALVRTGNDREATIYLERARAKDKTFAPVYPLLIEAYQRLGEARHEEELRRAYSKAVTAIRVRDHLHQAKLLDRDGKSHAAIAEIQAALQLDPQNARSLSDLGDLYFRQGRLDAALAQQRTAVDLDPQLADAHYRLALIYQQRADYAAARTHFEESVRLAPHSPFTWRVREELSRLPQ